MTWFQSLAQELPNAMGADKKEKKKKRLYMRNQKDLTPLYVEYLEFFWEG